MSSTENFDKKIEEQESNPAEQQKQKKNDPKKSGKKDEQKKKKKMTTCNDPAWYNHNPQLTTDAGSIPFVNYTGLPFNPSGNIPYLNPKGYVLPGIMKMNFIPTYGHGSSASDALNVASNKNYAEMRRWNSGSRNYEAPDYMLHFMAIDNAYILWAFAARAYGILNEYNFTNRYTPRYLIESMNLDFDDLKANQADFRTAINQFAAKLNSCPIPKDLDIIKRHLFMVSNLYIDHANAKSQYYYFQPEFLYQMDKTKRETGGCLVPFDMPSNTYHWDVSDFRYAFDTIIENLLRDEDFSIMGGDTIKAFSNVWSLGQIPGDFRVTPLHDVQILEQIHNAKFVGHILKTDLGDQYTPDIYQENGVLIHHPMALSVLSSAGLATDAGYILDTSKDATPTPLEVMYMSRLGATLGRVLRLGSDPNFTYIAPVTSFGSEIMTTCQVYYLEAGNNNLQYEEYSTLISEGSSNLVLATRLVSFDWHPRFIIYRYTDGDAPSVTSVAMLWETKNIAVLSEDNVSNLHSTAVLSLLDLRIKANKEKS